MHTQDKMTTNWQQNTENDYKFMCHSFEWVPAMILEPVIMEYKE